jgi:hypothetical protein
VLGLAGYVPVLEGNLLMVTSIGLALQCIRIWWRMYFTARVYGVAYAALVPVRIPWSNLVNTLATLSALSRFAKARWRNEPMVWLKTEHAYPNREALNPYTRRLGEVLTDLRYLSVNQLEESILRKPEGIRIGEHLVAESLITERQLYEGLSVLSGYDTEYVSVHDLEIEIARSLPRSLMLESRLQPVRLRSGSLVVASSEIPKASLLADVRRFTRRDPVVVLVTPDNLRQLQAFVEEPVVFDSAA